MAKVVFRQVGSALVAHLSGEIDHHAAEKLRQEIEQARGQISALLAAQWGPKSGFQARWSSCVWILGALGLWIPRAWG